MDASLFSSSCSLARADWRRKGWGEEEGEGRGEKEEVEEIR